MIGAEFFAESVDVSGSQSDRIRGRILGYRAGHPYQIQQYGREDANPHRIQSRFADARGTHGTGVNEGVERGERSWPG